ncbi:type IV secretory system conjugative DNA transfer family protein [Streptomyces flavidovirens]|uniref:type IV secretory system conjugative DNA transfer family protein n=1 Tax=Streptomyces flavidovirens TaxID=67298 RepID=UPI0004040680|nr:type IV secretory system conjugative DNA transfer family protein [Streptomyces flavidovirens]
MGHNDERQRYARQGERGVPDSLLVGLLAFLLGLTVLAWLATGLAGLFTHGAWPDGVTFARTPLALRRLMGAPHDIPAAWPDTPADQLSGYGLFWGLLIGELMVLCVLTIFVLGVLARLKAQRETTRAATRATKAPAPEHAPGLHTHPGDADAGPDHDPGGPPRTGAGAGLNTAGGSPGAGAGYGNPAHVDPGAGLNAAGGSPGAGYGHGGPAHAGAGTGLNAAGGSPGAAYGPGGLPHTGAVAGLNAAGSIPGAGYGHGNPPHTGPGTGPLAGESGGAAYGPGALPHPGAGAGAGQGLSAAGATAADGYGPGAGCAAHGASVGVGPYLTGPDASPQQGAAPASHAPASPHTQQPATAALPTPEFPAPRAPRLLYGSPEVRRPTAVQAVLDAEGAALVVTSDPTVWAETKDARAKLGPVLVYDPGHLCDTPARLHWSPTTGCERADIAAARAVALLAPLRPQARLDAAMADTAETLLSGWLHAAAVDGRPFRQVHRWAQGHSAHEPVRILRTHPKASSGAAGLLESALTAYPERREIAQELTVRALAALSSIHIREACTPNRTDSVTLESFAGEGGTLYVVGEAIEDPKSRPGAMPLLTALTSSVVEHGRRMAARSSDGRLDPPMTFVLDDVAAVAPLPQLPELLSTGQDQGLPTLVLLRSQEQGRARWPDRHLTTG